MNSKKQENQYCSGENIYFNKKGSGSSHLVEVISNNSTEEIIKYRLKSVRTQEEFDCIKKKGEDSFILF